ncbi:MAG: efflux RND transporter periplasmic adaptor subunit [Desulfonatronovibrio sp.]
MIGDNQDLSADRTSEKKKGVLAKVFGPWTIFILVVALSVFFYLKSSDEEETEEESRKRPPVAVETAPAAAMTLADTVAGVGTLRPMQNIEIKPEVEGRIKAVHFQEGGYVSKDKLLFEVKEQKHSHRLASSQAALEKALSNLENLQRTHERFKKLREQDLISEDDFDQVESDLESAESEVRRLAAQVRLSREEMGDTVLRAPFSGYISRRLVDPGAFVSKGELLATMYQTDPLEISFMVSEKYSPGVKTGQKAVVKVSAYPGEEFEGEVSFVSPSIEESTRSFEVRAFIDNPDNRLKPGFFAEVQLVLGYREEAVVVPERSLVATRKGYLVFVLDEENGNVQSRTVQTGARRPGVVEISEGLSPGEIVIVSGHMNLDDQMEVDVVNEEDPDWVQDLSNLNQTRGHQK